MRFKTLILIMTAIALGIGGYMLTKEAKATHIQLKVDDVTSGHLLTCQPEIYHKVVPKLSALSSISVVTVQALADEYNCSFTNVVPFKIKSIICDNPTKEYYRISLIEIIVDGKEQTSITFAGADKSTPECDTAILQELDLFMREMGE